jgi:hypothetical protein
MIVYIHFDLFFFLRKENNEITTQTTIAEYDEYIHNTFGLYRIEDGDIKYRITNHSKFAYLMLKCPKYIINISDESE